MGFMDAFDDFVTAVDDLCTAICSMEKEIGVKVAEIAASLLSELGPVLSLAGAIDPLTLACVVLVVAVLAKGLGISDSAPEELGDVALNHPEIDPKNYESYSEYLEELKKHKDEFNKEEFEKKPLSEQAAALAVGTGILVKGLEDNLKMEIPLDFLATMVRGGITPSMTQMLLTSMSEKGLKSAGVFTDYINGNKLSEAKTAKMDSVMAEFKANGGSTVEEICTNIESGKGINLYKPTVKVQ